MRNIPATPVIPSSEELTLGPHDRIDAIKAAQEFENMLFGIPKDKTTPVVANLLQEVSASRQGNPPKTEFEANPFSYQTTSDQDLNSVPIHCNVARPTMAFPDLDEIEKIPEIEAEAEQTTEEREVEIVVKLIKDKLSEIGSLSIEEICQCCPETIIVLVFEALLEELNNKYRFVDRHGQVYTIDRVEQERIRPGKIFLLPETTEDVGAIQYSIVSGAFKRDFRIQSAY